MKTKKIEVTPSTLQEDLNKDLVTNLLKERVSKLFDREPGSYSEQRLNELVEDIIKLF